MNTDRKSTKSKDKILCLCGCGELRDRYDKDGRERRFIFGHGTRGKNHPLYGRLDENNPSWKGISYDSVHRWVKRRLFKPDKCPKSNRKTRLEACNISGEYLLDLNDWEYLCHECHLQTYHSGENHQNYGYTPWNKGIEFMSGDKHPLYGKHHSEDTKKKLSLLAKERFKDKTKHPRYGKHCSEDTKRKISEANKKKTVT